MTGIRDGDSYVLNGTRIFITDGGEADIYTIGARLMKEASRQVP